MKAFTKAGGNDPQTPWICRDLPFDIEPADTSRGEPLARLLKIAGGERSYLGVLLTDEEAGLRVNGAPSLPVSLLSDRDEIGTADGRIFLFAAFAGAPPSGVATESPAISCARCHRSVAPGDRWVGCNACSARYHADPPLQPDGSRSGANCRDYDARCAGCQRTRASMQWTPQELGYDD
jgi:hypothetical protein